MSHRKKKGVILSLSSFLLDGNAIIKGYDTWSNGSRLTNRR